jgi:hypothetical protein
MWNDLIKPSVLSDEIEPSNIFGRVKFTAIETPQLGILVTPECDLENDKVDYINFCAVLPFNTYFYQKIETAKIISKEDFISGCGPGKMRACADMVKKVLNGNEYRYHFLGKLPNELEENGLWYVDYQLTESILKPSDLEELKGQRVAKLISPLKESIFVRFANYWGRIGLPGKEGDRDTYVSEVLGTMKGS